MKHPFPSITSSQHVSINSRKSISDIQQFDQCSKHQIKMHRHYLPYIRTQKLVNSSGGRFFEKIQKRYIVQAFRMRLNGRCDGRHLMRFKIIWWQITILDETNY